VCEYTRASLFLRVGKRESTARLNREEEVVEEACVVGGVGADRVEQRERLGQHQSRARDRQRRRRGGRKCRRLAAAASAAAADGAVAGGGGGGGRGGVSLIRRCLAQRRLGRGAVGLRLRGKRSTITNSGAA